MRKFYSLITMLLIVTIASKHGIAIYTETRYL